MALTGLTGQPIHRGSWNIFGISLPDFGITEKISDLTGQSRNIQGGSQLRQGTIFNIGNVPYTYSTVQPTTRRQSSGGQLSGRQSSGKQSLSISTPSSGGGGSQFDLVNQMQDPSSQLYQEWLDRQKEIIESGYDQFIQKLDELAGLYPQWEQEDVSRLETSKQQGLQDIETAKTGATGKLDLARQQTLEQERQAKSDIMSQLRQLLKASQMRAGLMGAGWSSAAQEVLPAVLGKQAAQAGAQVARGTMSNLNQIDQKIIDVNTTYDLTKGQLLQDFNDKLTAIKDKYRQLKQWVETEKANAGLKKSEALANLDTQLMSNLVDEANYLKQQYLQQQQALQQWALDRIAQLNNYKIQMGQLGTFEPAQLAWSELRGIGDLIGRTGGGWQNDIYGALVDLGKRRREQFRL